MIRFISQSMYGQFMRCPAQFERRWVQGEIIPPGVAARRGSATHKAAEHNHIQKVDSGVDLPLDELQDVARDEYIRLVREEGIYIPKEQLSEKNQILGGGLDAAVGLTKVYREELAPLIQPAWAEKRIQMDVGLPVPVEGTIDVLTVDGWMPDLKTADKSKNQNIADNSLQLTLYAGLVYHDTGNWPKKLSLEVLVNNKVPILQSLITTRDLSDWNQLILRFELFLKQLEAGIFPPCEPGAWICSPTWCGYYNTCRYAMKRR